MGQQGALQADSAAGLWGSGLGLGSHCQGCEEALALKMCEPFLNLAFGRGSGLSSPVSSQCCLGVLARPVAAASGGRAVTHREGDLGEFGSGCPSG